MKLQKYHNSVDKVKATLVAGAGEKRYICEVQRELYDFILDHVPEEHREKGLDLVAESFIMGKKLSNKLADYNHLWFRDEWDDDPDYAHKLDKRAKRKNLLYRIQSVQIQTIDYCNRKCSWCPNSYMKKSPKNIMENDVLNRILKQLKDLGYKGEIHPYLMGEPLMDKRILSIIRLIKTLLPDNQIKIITNGDKLKTTEQVNLLLGEGVDRIHINHYDDTELDKVLDKDYPQISHFGLKHLMPTFNNRGGKVDYAPDVSFRRCTQFLRKLAFNYRGEMVLCCADYDYSVVFGNIMDEPLTRLLESYKYLHYKKYHEEGKGKEMPLCKECNYI